MSSLLNILGLKANIDLQYNKYEMYVDIRIQTLEEMMRKVIRETIKEMKEAEQAKSPPLSIPQLASHFSVSKATIHNWLNRKMFIGHKVGKGRFFHLNEVEESLKKYGHYHILENAA